MAAAVRAQVADRGGERRKGMQRLAELVEAERLHMELEVRRGVRRAMSGRRRRAARAPWSSARVAAAHIRAGHAGLADEAARGGCSASAARRPCRSCAAAGGPAGFRRRPGRCMHDVDAVLRRAARGPMPDSCSRCGEPIAPAARMTSRAARTLRLHAVDARSATPATRLSVEAQAASPGRRSTTCRFVRASAGCRNALRGAPAPAAALVDLEIAAALVVAAIEIVGLRDADPRPRPRGTASRISQASARLLDPPFAARAVHVVGRARARSSLL